MSLGRLKHDTELDDYDPTDSEDEYDQHQKELLKKYRSKKREYSDSEDEVYGVASNDDSSEGDKSEIALSDVEGQEDDDDLPDIRAWGKDKKKFYGADYVDPDYGGFQGKDAQSAEIEEEEARNLQNQLLQQLDDGDFSLELFQKTITTAKDMEDTQVEEEVIKKDISQLSRKQKLQILKKESPEFFGLIEDFEIKMSILKNYLYPLLQKYRKGQIPNGNAIEFVQTQYHLVLNYVSNIYMYLLLRDNKNLLSHPVVKRLYQYRQLLAQLEPVFEEIIKPQIEILLSESAQSDVSKKVEKTKKKTLQLLFNLKKKPTNKEPKQKSVQISENVLKSKKIKLDIVAPNIDTENLHNSSDEDDIEREDTVDDNENLEENIENQEEVVKRAITYQIAKNKGLTPHRKKELRNPRVKNKLKYRKAIIRRKGAVREPRKELSRYSGEISGIKASVSKSIKFKS